jgi:hypothetical protein
MTRAYWLTSAILALGFSTLGFVGGCSSDSDDGDEAKGGTGGTATGGTSGDAAGAANEAGAGNASAGFTECDPEGEGVCQNAADCPLVENGKARGAAQECGLTCLGSADTCAAKCIEDKKLGLSAECGACYLGIVACTTEKCLTECVDDPAAKVCGDCQSKMGCRAAFDSCSGLKSAP